MDAPITPPPQLAARAQRGAPLAPYTSLDLGGPAALLIVADDDRTMVDALSWADGAGVRAVVIGGGSNLVVADAGFDGVVVRAAQRGVVVTREGEAAHLSVAAGEPWDEVVAMAVAEGWAGIECLSGVPGTAGATPIQNVGAYGQEVSETITGVRVVDRSTLQERLLVPAECRWSYRDSVFRRDPERYAVLSVAFRLRPGARPTVRYPELARTLGRGPARPDLAAVRAAVLDVRRRKSMLLDAGGENRRSVGSFFLNPVVSAAEAHEVTLRAMGCGAAREPAEVPRFAVAGGGIKLSAAWLVERAGFSPGTRRGNVGVSSHHALALVHHGGGTAAQLVALAAEIRGAVQTRFGVTLTPEPSFLGFGPGDPLGGDGRHPPS